MIYDFRKIESEEVSAQYTPSSKELSAESEEFEKIWSEYKLLKMDVDVNSKWYILSFNWLQKWREYVASATNGSSSDVNMQVEHPGMILNDDIIMEEEHPLIDHQNPQYEYALKENLKEEDNYYVVNFEVWDFLYTRYGGIQILRVGVDPGKDLEPFIEVNLLTLNVHFFPGQQDSDIHVYTMNISRYQTIGDLHEKLADFKGKNTYQIRLWKAPMPSDFEKFYRDNL